MERRRRLTKRRKTQASGPGDRIVAGICYIGILTAFAVVIVGTLAKRPDAMIFGIMAIPAYCVCLCNLEK